MIKERVRFINCYLCGVTLKSQEAVRKTKGGSGEDILLCSPCNKRAFPKKVKLIKRSIEQWPQD